MTKVVLCADDDENMLTMMRMYLEAHGYAVLTENRGRAALGTATMVDGLYALVLDYVMPDISGGEVCFALRKCKPELPIIMFSGSYNTIPAEVRTQVDKLISKDAGMPALLAALDRISREPRLAFPDRRRFPRYSVNWPISVQVTRADTTAHLDGHTTTIGEGGLGGTLKGDAVAGEHAWLAIYSPPLVSLKPRVRICYRRADLYGFEFLDLSLPQQLALRRSCDRLASGIAR